mmetsp:Transcript_10869/g.32103  ORF Transcript_10869/g.32103 Transcript_10869/m.32103 type:complete len:256 (+) Transcript_10869:2612-3379(+)
MLSSSCSGRRGFTDSSRCSSWGTFPGAMSSIFFWYSLRRLTRYSSSRQVLGPMRLPSSSTRLLQSAASRGFLTCSYSTFSLCSFTGRCSPENMLPICTKRVPSPRREWYHEWPPLFTSRGMARSSSSMTSSFSRCSSARCTTDCSIGRPVFCEAFCAWFSQWLCCSAHRDRARSCRLEAICSQIVRFWRLTCLTSPRSLGNRPDFSLAEMTVPLTPWPPITSPSMPVPMPVPMPVGYVPMPMPSGSVMAWDGRSP